MLERLRSAWRRSDRLLGLLTEAAWLERPIPLRQPFLFYLGHLPAFAWNQIGRGSLGRPGLRPEFETLFERGIDLTDLDAYTAPAQWPERDAVVDYRDRVRAELDDTLCDPGFPAAGVPVVAMVVEHELMHQETLLYMLQELDHGLKTRPAEWPKLPDAGARPTSHRVEVPAGDAVLGAAAGSLGFGWDNEFPLQRVHVPAFAIDEYPVTNAEFLEFVESGGYAETRLWGEDDWAWRARQGLNEPHSWSRSDAGRKVRGLLENVPFEDAALWPAMLSWAEASAYARWRGDRLPTEPEWQRAARGVPRGEERSWPWGDASPTASHGNFHFVRASPTPVGSHPAGASAWGVQELVGNGWEWTGTPFGPFPGFTPMPRYPGYSADFFDGRHFVLRGGSWATDAALLRPSLRNWFQPHYPYVFSKFRCARSL
jgi:ergothioneine biosynthesis protein EgtB